MSKKDNDSAALHGWQLKKCENPWKPNMHHGQSEVYRRMLGILNRVTNQSLPVLLKQALELPIVHPDHLPSVLALILSKSEDEPLFCSTYAQFCADISQSVALKEPLAAECLKHFSESLQNVRSFEEKMQEPVTMEIIQEEILARRRLTVHIGFVCQLERKGLVSQDQLESMAATLLTHGDLRSMECLCRLLTVHGAHMDPGTVSNSCSRLETILASNNIPPPRLRFLFEATLDLRDNGWRPRQRAISQGRNSRG